MTDDQFKVALLEVLSHIGDGLHRIADAKLTENELLAEDGDTPATTYLNGQPVR